MELANPLSGEIFLAIPSPPSQFLDQAPQGIPEEELRELWFEVLYSLITTQMLSRLLVFTLNKFNLSVLFQEALPLLVRKAHSPSEKARFHRVQMSFLTYFPIKLGK